ncbi:putative nuclease [Luteibacter phage vB_LflM-Pluto]|uniref:Nuclease n=1 Tax=Luteibacter phage vB_LflM-Pluto TaxID=2948611 RepID=A0A9E7MV68_9CAUD|nr:putative nuclease [Luteibacter phage vB_LflM-Pluto]
MSLRIENLAGDGTPDVKSINRNGVSFWIENKAIDGWPKRPGTAPLRDKFEPGQLPYLRQWRQWGGKSFVLLRVDKEFFLLDPSLNLPSMTSEQIIASAIVIGKEPVIKYLENLEPSKK